jgi:hypothetical protein
MQNLFRKIHKNSWLKRVDSRKVLQKVSEQLQFWMYWCHTAQATFAEVPDAEAGQIEAL